MNFKEILDHVQKTKEPHQIYPSVATEFLAIQDVDGELQRQ